MHSLRLILTDSNTTRRHTGWFSLSAQRALSSLLPLNVHALTCAVLFFGTLSARCLGQELNPEELESSGESAAAALVGRVDVKSDRVAAKFAETQRVWLERVVGAPARERIKEKSWAEEAGSFIADSLAAWNAKSIYELDEDLAARGRKLLEQGCDDPLIAGLAARFAYRGTSDHFYHWHAMADSSGMSGSRVWPMIEATEAMIERLRKLETQRGFLRLCAAELANHCGDANDRARGDRWADRGRGWLRAALTDGSYRLPEEEELLVAHVYGEPMKRRAYSVAPEWREEVEKAPLSPWARTALLGAADWAEAVRLRQAGKRTESSEQWEKMHGRWAEAWKLHPGAPELPELIFDNSWNAGSTGGAEPLEWLARVLAARFDYEPAYDDMITQLRPDWRGSLGALTAFGRACAATKRYDTTVPLVLMRALRTACMDGAWAPLCREPRTSKALVELGRGMVSHVSRATESKLWKSMNVVWTLLSDDTSAAEEALKLLGAEPLHVAALHELAWFKTSLEELRADLAIRRSDARGENTRGETHYGDGKLEGAIAAFRAALEQIGGHPAGRALIARKLAVAEFERAFAAGDWVKVPTELAMWNSYAGSWSNDAAGALVLEGDGHPAQIRFRARIGPNVEWRGDYSFTAPEGERFDPELGIAFRCMPGNSFLQVATWETGGHSLTARYRQSFWQPSLGKKMPVFPPEIAVSLLATNHFHLTADAARMSFVLNEQSIFEKVTNSYYAEFGEECQIGFVAKAQAPRNRTVIRNLEARRLADPNEQELPKQAPGRRSSPRVSPSRGSPTIQ